MFCFHDRVKQHTFSDTQTIKMCPDCTSYDTHRVEVLKQLAELPWSVDTEANQHWGAILNNDGLGMSAGCHEWLIFESDIAAMQPERKLYKRSYLMIDDNDWDNKQRPLHHNFVMGLPRKAFCPTCVEIVVDLVTKKELRKTNGTYLPVNHDCGLRVFDLHGTLLDVQPL